MTVYLDVVFVENLVINYIILLATGLINKAKIKHYKLIFASILGAIYSIFTYLTIEKIKNSITIKIIFSILMIYIAFRPRKIKKLFKQLLIFYLTTFAFGGVTFFLLYVVKPEGIFFVDGVWFGSYPIKIAVLGVVLGFVLIYLSFKMIKNGINKKNMLCNIEILFEGKKKEIRAMIDSGNLLKDPITNTPVVVVEKDVLESIIPKEILENLQKILKGEITDNSIDAKYISKFKIIPFSSIGKENGILLGIRIDGLKIYIDNETVNIKSAIIGIYDKPLCRTGEYSGLIGLDFIEKEMSVWDYWKLLRTI